MAEIKKVGPGTYAWVGRSAPAVKPTAEAPTEPASGMVEKAVSKKPKTGKSGRLKDVVVGLVKASGKAGITVREIVAIVGGKAGRIYVWFGTTGKKVKKIKKVGPGRYAWVG